MSAILSCEWVMSHIWMSECNVTHMNEWVLLMSHDSCHTCEWVGACHHVTSMNARVLLFTVKESCHTYEWGISRECVSGTFQWQNEGAEMRWLPHGCVLQCVAVCSSMLQYVAACCSDLEWRSRNEMTPMLPCVNTLPGVVRKRALSPCNRAQHLCKMAPSLYNG